jgi:hypothetical protein
MKSVCIAVLSCFVLVAACTSTAGGPAENPEPPGATTPGSPATVWTTTGGPASPGVPSTGTIIEEDAGSDAEP